MSTPSPLFQSAFELYAHAMSHYVSGKELDRKLVILHLANAVELILKDLLLSQDISIYKNPKETVSIQHCIESISKLNKLPYLNKIELLIDERNSLQHRFGSPNELTTLFYMETCVDFFKRVLQDNYDLEYDIVISQFADQEVLEQINGRQPSNDNELRKLKKVALVHPLSAYLAVHNYAAHIVREFSNKIDLQCKFRRFSSNFYSKRFWSMRGVDIPAELIQELESFDRTRYSVSFGREEPSKEDVDRAITVVEKLYQFLNNADIESLQAYVASISTESLEQDRVYLRAYSRPTASKSETEQLSLTQPAD